MLKLKRRKVSIKIADIMGSSESIRKLVTMDMPAMNAFAIASNLDILQPILDRAIRQRTQILEKHGAGNSEESEDDGKQMLAAQEEWDEVMMSEVEVDIFPVSLEMDIEIPPALIVLAWFLFEEVIDMREQMASPAEVPAEPPDEG